MNESLRTELIEILTNLAIAHDARAITLMNSVHGTPEGVSTEQNAAKYVRQVIERVKEA